MQYGILVIRFAVVAWNILVDCCFLNDEKFKFLVIENLKIWMVELFKDHPNL